MHRWFQGYQQDRNNDSNRRNKSHLSKTEQKKISGKYSKCYVENEHRSRRQLAAPYNVYLPYLQPTLVTFLYVKKYAYNIVR